MADDPADRKTGSSPWREPPTIEARAETAEAAPVTPDEPVAAAVPPTPETGPAVPPRRPSGLAYAAAALAALSLLLGLGLAFAAYTQGNDVVAGLQGDLDTLKGRLDTLDGKVTGLEARIGTASTVSPQRLTDLDAAVKAAAARADTAATEAAPLRRDLDAAKADAAAARTAATQAQQTAAGAQQTAASATQAATAAANGLKNAQTAAQAARQTAEAAAATAAKANDAAAAVAARPVPPPVDLAPLGQRLAGLESRLGPIETALAPRTSNQPGPGELAGLAVASNAILGALERGVPFTGELAAAASLGADPAQLAPLRAVASGAKTAGALGEAFRALAPSLASRPADASAGWWERMKAEAGGLVRIRGATPATGTAPDAVASRIAAALDRGDTGAAWREWQALPDSAKALAGGAAFAADLRARVDADTAARALLADSLARLGRSRS